MEDEKKKKKEEAAKKKQEQEVIRTITETPHNLVTLQPLTSIDIYFYIQIYWEKCVLVSASVFWIVCIINICIFYVIDGKAGKNEG